MASYDHEMMINFVDDLLSKGFVVSLHETFTDRVQQTLFRKRCGHVFAKNRKCFPKPVVDGDGWEVNPLEFQDWWVDIIVDDYLTNVSVIRYHVDEQEVWNVERGFKRTMYHIPPLSISLCKATPKPLSLKELSVLALRDIVGFNSLTTIEYMLDKTTTKTAKSSLEWWVSL